MLWRKSVDWTTRRVVGTAVAAAVALLLGIVAYLLWGRQAPELGAMIGSVAAPTAWLIATVWIWRETPVESAARTRARPSEAIVCPRCGYNLTGLTEARCPECGTQYTLDELIAAQPTRDTALSSSEIC